MAAIEAVWASIDGLATPALYALLDPTERARADRFRFARDRARFIARRGLLRQLLVRHIGGDPATLAYRAGAFGKPSLATSGPRFSTSHSHGIALFAIAPDIEIGCDIERFDERIDSDRIAQRLFAPQEIRVLRQAPPESRRQIFFQCWTRKEAVLKALGTGLSQSSDRFDVLGATVGGPSDCALASFEPLPGFYVAIAGLGKRIECVLQPWGTVLHEVRKWGQ